jgi:hypothetical protein
MMFLRTGISVCIIQIAFAGAYASESAADRRTLALWLFDETPYPNCILTDASMYEHDLRLTSPYEKWWEETEGESGAPKAPPLHVAGKYGLVKGKYGNALYTPPGERAMVLWPRRSQRYGEHAYLSDVGNEVPERLNLGYFDFTIEFWFKAIGRQTKKGTIFRIANERNRYSVLMVNALFIDWQNSQCLLSSEALSKEEFKFLLPIPTDIARLKDGQWHHLAFTYNAEQQQIRHYLDGVLQELPKKGGFLPTQNQLISLEIGTDLNGLIDEYRISDIVRYKDSFLVPGSFSRNQAEPRSLRAPTGPPLLIGSNGIFQKPVPLGSRKHLFIDAMLLESMQKVELICNPPLRIETSFRNTEPWEPGPRHGSTIPYVMAVWHDQSLFKMLYSNSGMWAGRSHATCFATSKDGLNWEKPILKLKPWGGNVDNNIVLRQACYGTVIVDDYPDVPADERFKLVAWSMYWGFHVFVSPDGIHWRRNEVTALPFDPDGSISTFWDDQCGIYRSYIRVKYDRLDPFSATELGTYRAVGRVETRDLMRPWPFTPNDRPNLEFKLAKPVRGEIPTIDTAGQVYRFQAHKYEWAPDTYLAFPWRYVKEQNVLPGSFLMASRDGESWTRYESPYYFPSGWLLNGRDVVEAVTHNGLIRQGNEIWQYGTARFTAHGGALYGGDEREGSAHDRLLLLKQRLDGFVSLDAHHETGVAVTHRCSLKEVS